MRPGPPRNGSGAQAVVVVDRDDIAALRTALLVEHLRPGIHLTVTIFDRTVAEQVRRTIPNIDVLSAADAAMGAVLGPCVDADLVALHRRTGDAVRVREGRLEIVDLADLPIATTGRLMRWLSRQLRPSDRSSRLLLASLCGLLGLLVAEVALTLAVAERPRAFSFGAQVPRGAAGKQCDWLIDA